MNLRARWWWGGGDHFDVNTASANEIESEMNQRLEKVKEAMKSQSTTRLGEAVYELVMKCLIRRGKRGQRLEKFTN